MSNPAAEILAYPLNKHMGAYNVQFVWQCGPDHHSGYFFDLAWWPDLPPPLSTDPILVGTNIAFPAVNGGPPVLMRVLDWTWVPSDGDWTLVVTVERAGPATNNGPESDRVPDPIVAEWHEVGDPGWLPWFRRSAVPTGPSPDDTRYERTIWGKPTQGQVRG